MLPGSLDSGPIYGRDFFELQQDSYISEVYEWGREKIPLLFLNLMHDIQNLAFVPEYQSFLNKYADGLNLYMNRMCKRYVHKVPN